MSTSKHQVQLFLREFKMAAGKGAGITYGPRAKNWDTLVDLNMTGSMRNDVILGLTWRNYSRGPLEDDRGRAGDVWVFGVGESDVEIYIKLKLSGPKRVPVCISFHPSKHPMCFPFRSG